MTPAKALAASPPGADGAGNGYTDAVATRTAPLYERVRSVVPAFEWPVFAPDIDAILRLKRARNAVILAHNYQPTEIFHCVDDIVGDSPALEREAAADDSDCNVVLYVNCNARHATRQPSAQTTPTPTPAPGPPTERGI